MKKLKNVLILEAGGPCGISCIKLLKKNKNVKVVATDMFEYAAGLQLADVGIKVSASNNSKFPREVERIIDGYKIDIIMPSFEHGHGKLRYVRGPFVTDFKSAILCKDKLEFIYFCFKNKLPAPKTSLLSNGKMAFSFPVFIKPRFGVGSRDNFIVNNPREFKKTRSYISNARDFLVQEFLRGNHWNVDVLVDDNRFICAVPRMDLVQKSGNCITVKIKNYKPLIEFSKLVQKTVGIKSPFNLEVFEIAPERFVINEINVRFGGGIIFSAMAGVDMVSYLVDKNKNHLGTIKEAIFTRYYEELPIDLEKIVAK